MVVFSDYRWQDFTDTGKNTSSYIVFYQCGRIDNCTHVTGTVAQSSSKSEYNAACTTWMDLFQAYEKVPILGSRTGIYNYISYQTMCLMANNGKDTKISGKTPEECI